MRFSPTFLSIICIVCSLVIPADYCLAQSGPQSESTERSLYGTDDLLALGSPYRPVFRRAKGHQYYSSNEVDVSGQLWIKGVQFSDIPLLYDLELDELVGKVLLADSSTATLVFETIWLDSFILHDQLFYTAESVITSSDTRDYLAFIYRGSNTFFLEFNKSFIDSYNKSTPYGRYSEQRQRILLLKDNELLNITSPKKLFEIFPDKKDEIKAYLKSNRIRYRKISPESLKVIAHTCES